MESNYKAGCDRKEQVNDEEAVPRVWGDQKRRIYQVYFSVAVTSRFLRLSVARIFPSESRKTRLLVSSLGEYLLSWAHDVGDASLANFMVQEGQCPSEAQMLRETLSGPPRTFLNFLPRLGLQRDHRRY
jgi:hypothetical protein